MDKEVIIITGACGRIGSSIVRRLGNKYKIVGFELLKALYATADEELVPVDISSDESVAQALIHIKHFYGTKIAAVIHLAAYYSFTDQKKDKYEAITVRGTERLLKGLQEFEVGQFIFSSTMLVHAPCEPDQAINEDWPVIPDWAYPESKVETEEVIHRERGKIPTVIMRIAGVYDDRCHSIPISNQIQRIYEKQLTSRLFPGDITHGSSFLHMSDLVDAIELAVDKRASLPQELVILVGEPKTLSYDYLQRRISQLLFNKEFKTYRIPKIIAKIGAWVQDHTPFMPTPFIKPWMIDVADDNYTLDITRASKTLGWDPKNTIDGTLPKMITALKEDPVKWYKEHQLLAPKWLNNPEKR